MDEQELQEYKQKLKGLSLKDLSDILSHINRDKVPEKYAAVEAEIASRAGASAPKAEEAKPRETPAPAALAPAEVEPVRAAEAPPSSGPAKPSAAVPLRKSKTSFGQGPEEKAKPAAPAPVPPVQSTKAEKVAPSAPAAKPKAVPGSAKNPVDLVLTAASVLFVLAGIYFLLVPFVNVPGAAAIKALFIKLPPHF